MLREAAPSRAMAFCFVQLFTRSLSRILFKQRIIRKLGNCHSSLYDLSLGGSNRQITFLSAKLICSHAEQPAKGSYPDEGDNQFSVEEIFEAVLL